MGRVLVVNTLFESLFVYKLSVLNDMPEELINRVETMVDKYLWMGNKAKIARTTLQSSKNYGGL